MIRTLDAESKDASTLAFARGGKVVVSVLSAAGRVAFPGQKETGPKESVIHVWDVDTGKATRRMLLGKAMVGPVALAPDGKTAAVGMVGQVGADGAGVAGEPADRAIRLWEVATGRELHRMDGTGAMPVALAFSPDGATLASGEGKVGFGPVAEPPPRETPIHLWDAATGRERKRWDVRAPATACLAFAPDGKTLAWVAGGEQIIRFWDISDGREIRPPPGHRSAIADASFTPDGKTLLTVAHDRTLRFWDPATGALARQVEASDDVILFTALAADGRTAATGGVFQPTRLWQVASGRELRRFSVAGEHYVSCGDLAPDGKTLATSDGDGVIFWDTATGNRRPGAAMSRIAPSLVKAIRFAPDGKSVATVGGDWVRFWDVAAARETRRCVLPNKPKRETGFTLLAARIAFAPDGKVLAATSTRDGTIFLLDAETGRELRRLGGPENRSKALAFSPDGKILATGVDVSLLLPERELAISLWDVAAHGEVVRILAHHSGIGALVFSPDGKRLASVSDDATALVWDVAALIGRKPPVAAGRAAFVQHDRRNGAR